MEEKESTVSGSLSESESDSPSPVTSYSIAATATASSQPEPININATNTNDAVAGIMTSASANMAASGGQGMNGGGDLTLGKKKRGRPRKYDAEGNLIIRSAPASGFSLSPATPNATKKSSGKKKEAFGFGELFGSLAAWDFTPHIVTVNTGGDVAAEIQAFTLKGSRGICVLSANGAVSNVTIRQPTGFSSGLLTYEGRFEILSLTGSFVITETGGVRNTGGLSVSLAGPDGRVIGGGVAGILTAASPIQIVFGSFLPFNAKPQKRKYERKKATTLAVASSNAITATTGQVVPYTKPTNETPFGGQQPQSQFQNALSLNPQWIRSEPEHNSVISPDINVSAPSE